MGRIILLAFIWGWSFLFIKVAVAGMTPPAVAAARVTLGFVVMLVVLRLRGGSLPRDRTSWRHFIVMATVHSVVPFTLLAWGEERITSALTAVLNASTPLFAALVAAAALNERLRPPQVVGLALGIAGVAVAAGVGSGDVGSSSLGGAAAAVGAAACYGLGFGYARRHLGNVPPLVATTGQLLAATVLAAPAALVSTSLEGAPQLPFHRMAAVVLLGVFGTGFAYVLNYRAIAALGPTRASLVTYLVPLVAVTVGVAFLDEPFEPRLLVGGSLTVVGITLVHDRLRRLRVAPVRA